MLASYAQSQGHSVLQFAEVVGSTLLALTDEVQVSPLGQEASSSSGLSLPQRADSVAQEVIQ